MSPASRAISVCIHRLPHAEGLDLPEYQTTGSAGMDLYAAVQSKINIQPGGRALVATGIAIAVPEGFEAQVRSRSGLSIQHGLFALNAPGTIDSDYRGEICVILANLGEKDVEIHRGQRIAQLVVAPVFQVVWNEVNELPNSVRGEGGFGHTGI